MKTLDELAAAVTELQARRFPDQTLNGVAMHMLKEAQEAYIEVSFMLARLADPTLSEREKKRIAETQHEKIAEELFDTFALLVGTANALNIDLVEAGSKKIPEIEHRELMPPDVNGVIEHKR